MVFIVMVDAYVIQVIEVISAKLRSVNMANWI
uniref:Uncharacterized protein n=1 Tax=Syphacia muris TaxID=451379 RepID=A0A0N5AIZ1_9BILA